MIDECRSGGGEVGQLMFEDSMETIQPGTDYLSLANTM
jgi:hypothetical protein